MGLTGFGGSGTTFIEGPYSFDNELWFAQEGYSPHYAEHIVDPVDGKEKLIMADPHTRHAAILYNLQDQRIEWEAQVPGWDETEGVINNPHTARVIMEDVPNFGDVGDIYCCDRYQRIIVFDRATKAVKKTITVSAANGQWDPQWLHEACLSVDPDYPSLIITDYNGPSGYHYVKLRIADESVTWNKDDFGHASKVCPIKGAHASLHTPDYGGDYLICQNEFWGAVWEIRDSDGEWTWARPRDRRGPPLVSPHGAFRMGRTENIGWVTVVGTESGGGIMAIHMIGAPIWSIGDRAAKTQDHSASVYTANVTGLGEVTHVFATLDGRIGFVDWNGVNRSNVGILKRIPQKQHVAWQLGWVHPTTNDWDFIEYVPVADWDETWLMVRNRGSNALKLYIEGCVVQSAAMSGDDGRMETFMPEMDLDGAGNIEIQIDAGEVWSYKVSRPYYYILPMVKSAVADTPTTYDLYLDHKRD
ncbi:MAG: hypothetical protein SVY53_05080 [Chloroflexota bacterium]|nr:hypothetical protein [Chloroflexota bacterium]